MLYHIWEFIIILFESLLFVALVNKKLKKRLFTHSLLLQLITIFFLSIILYIMNSFNVSTVVTVTSFTILHFFFTVVFFLDSNIAKIFWTIVYSIYAIISESIVLLIPIQLFNINFDSIMTSGRLRIFFTLTYILVFSVLTLNTISLSTPSLQLKRGENYIFIVISLISIITEQIVLSALMITSSSKANKFFFMLTLIFFLVFFLFFSTIFYVYNLGLEKEKNKILTEEHLINNLEKKQYEQVISSVNELRILKHDTKNHIETLLSLINSEQYTKASSYLLSYYLSLDTTHYTVSSGNTPFDCIITNKLSLAASYNITTYHTVHLPEHIPLSDIEICSLIGNLYDNSIESCNKILGKKERFINLQIKPFNNMLSIKIQNSSNGIYYFNKNRMLKSTKNVDSKESINHGIGLKRIKEITESNNGFIDINPENDLFTVTILIPLTNQ